jgi:RNA polymerase sigma factor (sigma-70 family)
MAEQKRLTEEQREFIESKLDLATPVVRSTRSWLAPDEKLSAAHVGLCRAVIKWHSGKGLSFDDYAQMLMRNEIRSEGLRLRFTGRYKHAEVDFGAEFDIQSQEAEASQIDDKDELNTWRSMLANRLWKLSRRQLEVVVQRAEGKSIKVIADQMAMSNGTVQDYWERARKKLRA